ncbi:MFS transporter [Taibaiella helva]|uniref:MFS transporter n=1 Tax=Taibaiella helva TaxID=2301235 RepID=UPI001E391506|nr:MFS transporter [Taibaiella helva]
MSFSDTFLQKNPALAVKEFRYYLAIRFGLIFALAMQFSIVSYWVYHITGQSKLALGFVGLAEVIPVISCSLFSGHIVDQREKRGMLLKALTGYILLGLGLLYLSTPFAMQHLGHNLRLGSIFFLIFIGGILRSFLGPASFSLLGQLVPRSDYPNATSWSSMAWQIGAVLGPLIAGTTIAVFSPAIPESTINDMQRVSDLKANSSGIIIASALVFFIELLLLVPLLKIQPKPILKQTREPIFKSIGEGLKFVFKTPALLGAQCLDMFSVLFGGAVALLPAVQQEFFPDNGTFFSGATAFGFLRAAPGIGALITLGLLAFIPLRTHPGKKLFACVAGFGVSIIIFGLSRNFFLSFGVLVLSGMFDAVSVVIRGTILQLVTPDDMRGRVASVNTMFISSSNELGDFESGVMANWLGTVHAIVLGGCLTLAVVALTFWRAPQLRLFSFAEERGTKKKESGAKE